MEVIRFRSGGGSIWAGMGDYQLVSPDGQHVCDLIYETEPPRGDSLHRLMIDGQRFPGRVWGRRFTFSADGDWLGFSWAGEGLENTTVIADLPGRRFAVLRAYFASFLIENGQVVGIDGDKASVQALEPGDFDRLW